MGGWVSGWVGGWFTYLAVDGERVADVNRGRGGDVVLEREVGDRVEGA